MAEEAALQAMQAHAAAMAPAPVADDKAALIARNKKALEARKRAQDAAKQAELARELPPGWTRVESRSRPGEYVYENVNTEERQAWFPEVAAAEEVAAAPVPMAAPTSEKEALKKKNMEALAKRKAAAAAAKAKEADLPLPDGWKRVESNSRPGEIVYENIKGERQAWFPDAPCGLSEEELKKKEIQKKNAEALKKRKKALESKKAEDAKRKLPAGWKRVESRSRPGEFVYENEYTEERQAWFPEEAAPPPLPDGWRKVESRSYPGEFVYENVHTLERQAWVPTEPAPTTENQVSMPAAEQQAKANEEKKASVICQAKAVYDYAAVNTEEEIDLLEGDIINVEYKADNGWWVGKNVRTNKAGIFPGTYVEEM